MANFRVDAAFRSSRHNECYLFVKDKFVVVNYSPGKKKDDLVNKPMRMRDGFPRFANPTFKNGINCAFDTDDNKAFIFSGNECALIDFAPHSLNAEIRKGPLQIVNMFPCLRRTSFENGIDAAIRSIGKEVYLFKEDKYALINYNSIEKLSNGKIGDRFGSLYGTVFENGIDAAFASHVSHEAYVFKGERSARINFARNFIVNGRIWPIDKKWPSLRGLKIHNHPMLNCGLYVHAHHVVNMFDFCSSK